MRQPDVGPLEAGGRKSVIDETQGVTGEASKATGRAVWPRPMPFLLLLGSVLIFAYSLIVRGGFPPEVDSNIFPNLSLIMLIVGSGIMTVRTRVATFQEAVQWVHAIAVISIPVLLFLYTLAILSLGLVVSSFLLIALSNWALGERSVLRIGLVASGFSLFAWLMIVKVLGVYVPEVLLF